MKKFIEKFTFFLSCFIQKNQFSNISTHRIMIGDVKRTTAYKKAIRKLQLKNKTILDAGCGLGIMGFFAYQNGVKKIISVDNSSIIHSAKKVSKSNKFDSKISFIKCDLLKLRLSEKVDIIVHETIGNFLFNENTVKIISLLRARVLKREGIIVPDKISWIFAPVDLTSYKKFLNKSPYFWKTKPYGIKFDMLFDLEVFNPFHIELTDSSKLMSMPVCAYVLDYYTVKDLPKTVIANFKVLKKGTINAIVSWFNIHLYQDISLSTAPAVGLTHWKQIVFPLKNEIKVKKGDNLIYFLKTNNSFSPGDWKFGAEKTKL